MRVHCSFWEWKPLISFGVFIFGTPLKNYKNLRPVYLKEESTIYEKEYQHLNNYTYTIPNYRDCLRFYVDHKKVIESVSSEKMFVHNGIDLLKCSIEEIMSILDTGYDTHNEEEVFGEIHHAYFFDQLGLCIWEENKIVIKIDASTANK